VSYSGEAKWAHSEAEAKRLLTRGLTALELEGSQLVETRKGFGKRKYWLGGCASTRRRGGGG